jgi:hypothetical protein
MPSTYTKNKAIEKPANGSYPDVWDGPVNDDFDFIDAALGSSTSLNATSGSAVLSDTQYRSMFLNISGAISAPATYTIPSNVGGMWIVYNSTTDATGGPHAITIQGGGSGTSVVIPRQSRIIVVSDGANPNNNIATLAYVRENGTLTGTLTVTGAVTLQSTLAVTGTVTGSSSISDSIGNVRNTVINAKTASYALLATDNDKCISITTGGVTVPASVLSAGNKVTIYNNSGSSQTITEGVGVTMRLAGTANTGNRTLAQYGVATVLCVATDNFVIIGNGLS